MIPEKNGTPVKGSRFLRTRICYGITKYALWHILIAGSLSGGYYAPAYVYGITKYILIAGSLLGRYYAPAGLLWYNM